MSKSGIDENLAIAKIFIMFYAFDMGCFLRRENYE